jgi:N utilization substance protein A
MVKFDDDIFKVVALFQRITNVEVKDCIVVEGVAYFVVDNIKMAIGKNGLKAKNVERQLRARVKIYEFSEDPETFIRNLVPHIEKLEMDDGRARVQVSPEHKAKIIGRSGRNIKVVRKFLERLTPIKKLTVR